MGRAAQFGVGAAGLAVARQRAGHRRREPGAGRRGHGHRPGPDGPAASSPRCSPGAVQDDGGFDPTQLPTRAGTTPLFPLWLLKYLPNMVAAHISLAFNAQGPNSTIMTACVAGTQAVGEAFRLVARGDADVMLAGGADSRIDPLLMLAYTALGTLSQRRPPAGGAVPAVRPAARRVRPRRGGGGAGAGGVRAGEGRGRHDLRRGARAGQQLRRLLGDQAGPGGPRRRPGDPARP